MEISKSKTRAKSTSIVTCPNGPSPNHFVENSRFRSLLAPTDYSPPFFTHLTTHPLFPYFFSINFSCFLFFYTRSSWIALSLAQNPHMSFCWKLLSWYLLLIISWASCFYCVYSSIISWRFTSFKIYSLGLGGTLCLWHLTLAVSCIKELFPSTKFLMAGKKWKRG